MKTIITIRRWITFSAKKGRIRPPIFSSLRKFAAMLSKPLAKQSREVQETYLQR